MFKNLNQESFLFLKSGLDDVLRVGEDPGEDPRHPSGRQHR